MTQSCLQKILKTFSKNCCIDKPVKIQGGQKSVAFLCSNHYLKKKTNKENSNIKNNKTFRNKLNQGRENLPIENYKTFMQERKYTNKWKDTMFMDWKG